MKALNSSSLILSLALLVFSAQLNAETQVFTKDSLQQIKENYAGRPFLLVMWSIDCGPCREELQTIVRIGEKHPDLPVVMVSTDEVNFLEEIHTVLAEYQLLALENWAFPATQHMAIRYSIDPQWYGELPRTYLYRPDHQRLAKSGALGLSEVDTFVASFKQDPG